LIAQPVPSSGITSQDFCAALDASANFFKSALGIGCFGENVTPVFMH